MVARASLMLGCLASGIVLVGCSGGASFTTTSVPVGVPTSSILVGVGGTLTTTICGTVLAQGPLQGDVIQASAQFNQGTEKAFTGGGLIFAGYRGNGPLVVQVATGCGTGADVAFSPKGMVDISATARAGDGRPAALALYGVRPGTVEMSVRDGSSRAVYHLKINST